MRHVEEEDGLTPVEPVRGGLSRAARIWFLVPMLLAPIVLVVAGMLLIPTQWYASHSANSYMVNLGYADRLHNSDCQVLLYGDSGALTGLDPKLIQARTGLKTCNLAEFGGMTVVNDTMLMDRYLAHNPRPQYIVFMFSPEYLGRETDWNKTASFEALTWRLRQPIDKATAMLLLRHGTDMVAWSEQGVRMGILHAKTKPMSEATAHMREADQGRFLTPGRRFTECEPVRHDVMPDRARVQGLRTKYGVGGTQVIVDASEVPDCDPSLDWHRSTLKGLVDDDDPYPTVPIWMMVKGFRNHVQPEGAALISEMVAEQVAGRMHGDLSAKTVHVPAGLVPIRD